MRKFGLGTVLAVVGVFALGIGAAAIADRDDNGRTAADARAERSDFERHLRRDLERRFPEGLPGRRGRALPMPPPPGLMIPELRDRFARELAEKLDKEPDEVRKAIREILEERRERCGPPLP